MKKSINKLCKQCSTNSISSCTCIIKHCIWAQKRGYEENSFRNTFLYSSLNSYRSYSVIRRTVFFKKFLISTKNYCQSLGASYRRIFSQNIFLDCSYWYEFKQIKEHTVLVIDFYKYVVSEKNRGGSEKNRLSCVLLGIHSSSL